MLSSHNEFCLVKRKCILSHEHYRNDPKFLDRQVCANSVDPDQNAPNQSLHCLPFCLHDLDTDLNGKSTLFNF